MIRLKDCLLAACLLSPLTQAVIRLGGIFSLFCYFHYSIP